MVDATRALLDELMGKVRGCLCASSPRLAADLMEHSQKAEDLKTRIGALCRSATCRWTSAQEKA